MQVQEIPLSNIKPAESGERAKDVKSLAESIKAVGLIQPILITPISDGFDKEGKQLYKIIAGHRRYAATQLLKKDRIESLVLVTVDDRAQAMRISENMHRLPLTPLQEAEAIAKLRALGRSTEEIAADLAMGKHAVARRERLTKLLPAWLKRWTTGKEIVELAVAELIAIQSEATQTALLERFGNWTPRLVDLKRELANINHRLSSAPWNLKDALLVARAGACDTCSKRSSCQPLLFHDEVDEKKMKAADMCTDVSCWRTKLAAHQKTAIDKAKEKHPGLIFVSTGNGGDKMAVPQAESCLSWAHYDHAKKTDKNAKPAMEIDGDHPGRIVYVTTARGTSKNSGSPTKKSLSAVDDRKARRARIIINKIKDIIGDGAIPKPITNATAERKLQMLGAMLLHCVGNKKEWPGVSKAATITKGDHLQVLWDLVAGQVRLPIYSFADALEWIDAVRPFAETILGLNWADLEAEALKAVPDPKPKAGALTEEQKALGGKYQGPSVASKAGKKKAKGKK